MCLLTIVFYHLWFTCDVKHAQIMHCLYMMLRVCSLSPSVVVPVRVKARILKLVALPSPLAAPGVCTLMAVSTPEAKCHESSGYKEITLKRYFSHESHLFYSIIQEYINSDNEFVRFNFFYSLVKFIILSKFKLSFYSCVALCVVLTCDPCCVFSGGQNQG